MKNLWNDLAAKRTAVGVVGLGYVGLPLAHALAKRFTVIGYDCNPSKVKVLRRGIDPTGEVPPGGLREVEIAFSDDPAALADARFIIVAVPTPVDRHKRPDLTPLVRASEAVGAHMPEGAVVVYESTVYPGVTEDICVPILERASGRRLGEGFTVGYSPERINPGDQQHRLETIVKVVSGSDHATLELVAKVYGAIIKAGIHRAPSIKVAEAAKVIENTQRDLNIALMNELAIIFHKMGIDTKEVLAAAGTKWNFLKFVPGLVGGHCIGVDPYYLTFKAEELGYHPEVILAGRRINDSMGKFVAETTVKEMIRAGKTIKGARVLVLGLTFKENVPDLRNTRVVDILAELAEYGVKTLVHDPVADPREAMEEYGLKLHRTLNQVPPVDAVILAVPHEAFRSLSPARLAALCSRGEKAPVMIDVKWLVDPEAARQAGFRYWRL
ncbi:MAG: UDP-glucose dehydrogenase [Candidatus Ozemobacter sibiricus]|jgi:UDP-N-acetyl-D-galactosamine dehydrogenase|uniref:UDP-glucose dehydrogenase n=1 Tax=Candidatus Ozemobacter sibiricus TaxID=2268124 RepID=A0A367ZA51_9BACT|nr:MAG: UDP-glucose dehydrogenase [Candidatus Ozemobacter sibiricus]